MSLKTMPHTKVAVSPANTFTKDARAGANKFDSWLRQISDGYITLDRLAMAAGSIPVIGNAMAVVDTMLAIKEMVNKKDTNTLDWMNLAINVIGIIPGAGNAARTTLRPILHLVRDQALRHKGLLTEAVVTAILDHFLKGHKADIDRYIMTIQGQMDSMLKEVSRHAQRTLSSSADALLKIASGKVFDTRMLHQKSKEAFNKATILTLEGQNLYVVSLRYKTEAEAKDLANSAVVKLVPGPIKTKLTTIAAQLNGYSQKVDARIMGLAGDLLKLLSLLLEALKRRKNHGRSAAVTGKAQKTNPNARLDAATQQSKSKNKPSKCKSCGTGVSPQSIDFASGQETFTHVDFSLPGIMPISWGRTYCSGLITYEKGELVSDPRQYDQFEADLRAYHHTFFKDKNSMAYRVVWASTGSGTPDALRFSIGGAETLRGYEYGKFEGFNKFHATVENRTQINNTVQFVTFFDIGNAWQKTKIENGKKINAPDRHNAGKFADLKKGVGIGVRLNTPIGPLRFDYGWPLDPEVKGGQKTGGKFYFSFGQTF